MDGFESQYLDHLRSLTDEMDAAIKAIASDDPMSFAESVARQEVHVFTLATLRDIRKKSLLLDETNTTLRIAESGLLQTSRRYAALLKHSSKTIAVLSALCDSHLGTGKEARGIRSSQQTWSCEM